MVLDVFNLLALTRMIKYQRADAFYSLKRALKFVEFHGKEPFKLTGM